MPCHQAITTLLTIYLLHHLGKHLPATISDHGNDIITRAGTMMVPPSHPQDTTQPGQAMAMMKGAGAMTGRLPSADQC